MANDPSARFRFRLFQAYKFIMRSSRHPASRDRIHLSPQDAGKLSPALLAFSFASTVSIWNQKTFAKFAWPESGPKNSRRRHVRSGF